MAKQSQIIVLLDADHIPYQVCENAGLNTSLPLLKGAVTRTMTGYQDFINEHFKGLDCSFEMRKATETHLTGSTNYRNDIGTSVTYKGNRLGKEKPPFFYEVKDYIVDKYRAQVSLNEEADDTISIRACSIGQPEKVVVISPDKDMGIIPCYLWDGHPDHPMKLSSGLGYLMWQRRRNYNQVVGCGMRFFYWQLIMGDTADHIKRPWRYNRGEIFEHYEGIQALSTEWTLFKYALKVYLDKGSNYDRLVENGRLLWLRRKVGELWEPPGTPLEVTSSKQ